MNDLTSWRWLVTVIDHGGLKPAAERIHRTPSTISHAIKQLEARLGVSLVETEGRRLALTEAGGILVERIRPMLAELDGIQRLARQFGTGIEPELRLAVDQIVPSDPVHQALERLGREHPETRIELFETVLGGGPALLEAQGVDIYIGSSSVSGVRAEWLMNQTLVPCVARHHPLNQLSQQQRRSLSASDLRQHRQIVIRDSDPSRLASGTWLEASQRLTVDHLHTALSLIQRGIGFSWMPQHMIDGCERIVRLPLTDIDREDVPLSLYVTPAVTQGRAGAALLQHIRAAFGNSVSDES